MIVSLISAMGKNRVIGKDNDMMWHLPLEFKYFKDTTYGHCIITGRKNFEAQGRPLPGRTNIIVTRSKDLEIEGCIVVNSIEEALNYARSVGEKEAFITGGGEIYSQSLKFAQRIYLTEVDYEEEGDAYFPEFNESLYSKELVSEMKEKEGNPISWKAFLYKKKTS
jgi:dihydrofolate reductase